MADRPSPQEFARRLAERHGATILRGEPMAWWLGYGRGGNAHKVYARERAGDYYSLAVSVLAEMVDHPSR